jgi:hypothetical protein
MPFSVLTSGDSDDVESVMTATLGMSPSLPSPFRRSR